MGTCTLRKCIFLTSSISDFYVYMETVYTKISDEKGEPKWALVSSMGLYLLGKVIILRFHFH